MAERIKVAIVYKNDENWIGGSYYIKNLVAALNTLPAATKPDVVVLSATAAEFEQIKETGYPYLEYRELVYIPEKLTVIQRAVNRLVHIIKGYVVFPQPFRLNTDDIDIVFPAEPGLIVAKDQKKIYWIPDFQELYYPGNFPEQVLADRKQNHLFIAKTNDAVVFSSRQALDDFTGIFPGHSCKTFVLPFAVTHGPLKKQDAAALKTRYGLTADFYIAPNQFWVHKNQKIIIEAVNLLKKTGTLGFQVAFTGKEHDPANPGYAPSVKDLAAGLGLKDDIKFLGFIDRGDQLQLMDASLGVIQPSLFEGWSTVIEDGKALNKFIIASDLPVHHEQLDRNATFFNPGDAGALAGLMLAAPTQKIAPLNYPGLVENYAAQFMRILHEIMPVKA